MSAYTPTTEDVRAAWIEAHKVDAAGGRIDAEHRPRERIAEFDRWLATIVQQRDDALKALEKIRNLPVYSEYVGNGSYSEYIFKDEVDEIIREVPTASFGDHNEAIRRQYRQELINRARQFEGTRNMTELVSWLESEQRAVSLRPSVSERERGVQEQYVREIILCAWRHVVDQEEVNPARWVEENS